MSEANSYSAPAKQSFALRPYKPILINFKFFVDFPVLESQAFLLSPNSAIDRI